MYSEILLTNKTHKMKKRNNKKTLTYTAIAIIAVALVVIYSMWNGNRNKNTADTTEAEAIEIKFNKQGTLSFISSESRDALSTIDIEVANTDQLRARGLMYRKSIPQDAGMLFVFNHEEMQGFWMKNTYIALDMLFVNAERQIVTIHMNTTPMKEWNYASTAPALYVVEVNAGYCLQNNIKEGDFIEFEY